MIKKTLFLLCLLAANAQAADAPDAPKRVPEPEPELQIHSAQPEIPEKKPQAAESAGKSSENIVEVDEQMLLENTDLLARAMFSVVTANNAAGIKVLLPIYEKWPQHDKTMALYARGLLAHAEGRAAEAVGYYRSFIAVTPDAPAARWLLAQALFEDRQNEAAADQFDRLQSEDLPPAVRAQVEAYRKALRERDSWQFNAGLNFTREQNINQAPKKRRLGEQRANCTPTAADDCFNGWRFPAPIDAFAASYQIGAEKKWSLPKGWYATGGGSAYGKIYPSHTRYNDLNTRLSAGIGRADQRNDAGIEYYHDRRFYGNDPYSYSNGVRLHWNRWWLPKLQTLHAADFGRLKNTARPASNNQNRLFSSSAVYYRNARQYWLAGIDLYQERNKDDRSEDFNRYGLRTAWGQEWNGGLSTRLQLNAATRRYDKPSFFSNGENRRDKELGASLSLWHRAVHFKKITPRLTFTHSRNLSNDAFYEYGKSRMFLEVGKTF